MTTDTPKSRGAGCMPIIAATLAAVLAVFLLACAPEGGTSDGKSQPQGQHNGAGEPVVHLETYVDQKCSPYEVTIHVEGGVGRIPDEKIPVASGGWEHDLSYKSGKHLDITLGVFAKPGCAGGRNYCKITDGPYGSGAQPLLPSGTQVCKHTTKR